MNKAIAYSSTKYNKIYRPRYILVYGPAHIAITKSCDIKIIWIDFDLAAETYAGAKVVLKGINLAIAEFEKFIESFALNKLEQEVWTDLLYSKDFITELWSDNGIKF